MGRGRIFDYLKKGIISLQSCRISKKQTIVLHVSNAVDCFNLLCQIGWRIFIVCYAAAFSADRWLRMIVRINPPKFLISFPYAV